MTQDFRLAGGGRIDRSRRLHFRWDGRALTGHPGDTLASALVANGIRLAGRSFKYHRPRGLMAAGVEESNILVQLGEGARSTPNLRATEVPLFEGLVARPVNCWPNARFDLAGGLAHLSRFLGAGFYYKTFMWPDWHLFEGAIRRMAGLGRVAATADPDRYETRNAHCDVLIVGAGAAGLAAARAAAAGGARVILAEQDFEAGGRLLVDAATIDGIDGADWAAMVVAELSALPDVRLLLRTTVVGYHDHDSLTLIERCDEAEDAATPGRPRQRAWIVRAGTVVLATGAIERPLVFPGNDRPGVMLASASRHYVSRHAALPGRRAVVLTNNDDAYATALALDGAGATVALVVDLRNSIAPDLVAALAARGITAVAGGAVTATRGKILAGVRVRDGSGAERWVDADHLAMSGGFNPTLHLLSQSGDTLGWNDELAAFVPGDAPRAHCIGAAAGEFDLVTALLSGHRAGGGTLPAPAAAPGRAAAPIGAGWQTPGVGTAWVDFQNDVTVDDIALAARENYRSVEHLKRYTTLGMAPDQGKTANVNALAVMAALTGRSISETGHTRHRFPYTPVALGAFAGRKRDALYQPLRRLPAHDRHMAASAIMEDFGGWLRPAGYPLAGEDLAAAEQREARAVRTAAGLFEASPLGKIEVVGPDAGRFLDRIYANAMTSLKTGRVRYGLMLNDLGVIIDDGVCARLGDQHFLVCASSAGADHIALWLDEWLQCEWPDLDVVVAPVTAAWGVLTLTGPGARRVLEAVGTDIELAEFPHMSVRTGRVGGLDARVLRVSYTGETSYEINVAARRTPQLWNSIVAVGGVTLVGIDAWMVLRTEKGYLHIGGDTDGTTNPIDVGWGRVAAREGDFIGKRSLARIADQSTNRHQFVGLAAVGPDPLPIGGHIPAPGGGSQGYVTSSVNSPVLGLPVALAMVRGGMARIGESVTVIGDAGTPHRRAHIVEPVFYDKQGARLRG